DTIGSFPANLSNIGVIPFPHTHIPYSIVFFLALAIVFGVVLHATPLGRAIFAIGAGQEAAFFAGIRVKRIKFLLFVLSGMLGGVSIFGGRGTIAGVFLAVAVLGCLQTALTADRIPAQDQNIVVGGLLLASVIVPNGG